MKTKKMLAVLVTLSSSVSADEFKNLAWPIADPFAALAATTAAAKTASLAAYAVLLRPVPSGRAIGGAPPLRRFFIRREGEDFQRFLWRATKLAPGRSVDAARVSLCDSFGNVLCPVEFSARRGVPVDLDRSLHRDMWQMDGGCFVPVDAPAGYVVRRALVLVPAEKLGPILPDGTVCVVPDNPVTHALQTRAGRLYFPWSLVGDGVTLLAAEVVEAANQSGPRRYLASSTRWGQRGAVASQSAPPAWWPHREARDSGLSVER